VKVIITGICGFVGRLLAEALVEAGTATVSGLDSLTRAGSETNLHLLRKMGVRVTHGDIRLASDVDALPDADWIIDASANPSVVAGLKGGSESRQLLEHNLIGTANILEKCRRSRAGLILVSTSRVYSATALASLDVRVKDDAFRPIFGKASPGLSEHGIDESFPAEPPMSLYGATKRCSEILALEYAEACGIPVWIDRCGVLAGGGQFALPEQGTFSYWIHGWRRKAPLQYIGFDGKGHQVRDCLHPRDLAALIIKQLAEREAGERPRIVNVSGGPASARSLAQISAWCMKRFGGQPVGIAPEPRPYDLPWIVLDNRLAARTWEWSPSVKVAAILDEIAAHAEANPDWLEITGGA
jgi:CDP-paratose 2-epimerase